MSTADTSDVNDLDKKPQRTPDELRMALQNAETNLRSVKATKKSMTAAYNDQLKDIESEIVDILDQLNQLEEQKG